MIQRDTTIKDCLFLSLPRFEDNRGYFQRAFSPADLPDTYKWVEVNYSVSNKNVLRGMHVAPYAKYCFCTKGHIIDCVVDVRKKSPTYLKSVQVYLTEKNHAGIVIPPGCAHGFLAEDDATLVYLQSGMFDAKNDNVFNIFSPVFGLVWPKPKDGEFIQSEKDRQAQDYVTE